MFRSDKGFTLVELIMVIVIIGILASIAVPKFVNLQGSANQAVCEANQGAISSAAAMQYAAVVVNDPTQADWLENLDALGDIQAAWFNAGVVPSCPTSGTIEITNGVATCTVHTL